LILKKYGMCSKTNIIEIGGNFKCQFQKDISSIVNSYVNMEINSSCDSIKSFDTLKKNSFDIITSYFVLEHIANPADFLLTCNELLKVDGGILIIEVPNLYNYYIKPEGLHFFEHLNHFSPRTLSNLAQLNGFKLLEISNKYCSRDFGFVAIFKKELINKKDDYKDSIEYTLSKNSIKEGKKLFDDYQIKLNKVRVKIQKKLLNKENVLIWVANEITRDILTDQPVSENIKVVDLNPSKKSFLIDVYASDVLLADNLREYIKKVKLIIINSPMHAISIINTLKKDYVLAENVEIIVTLDKY